jgi:hypothetical protein
MSTTPRTDKAIYVTLGDGWGGEDAVDPNFARKPETELAAMKAEFERLANPCGWPHCEPAKADATELARLRAENDEMRVQIEANKRKGGGCQCADDEACAHVRRAEKAEAALAKAKATIEDICTGGRLTCDQCLEAMPCNCGHSPRRL